MGNALLDENKKDDPKQIYEQWVEQNPDLVSRKVLTFNNIFEANFFKYCEFSIKMQVFFRRDDTNIQDYLKAFTIIQNLVEKHKTIHLLPMRIIEMKEYKDKELQKYSQSITVAMRQYVHMTLQQRLQSRPALTEEEKIWIIYQMVFSLYTIHEVFNIYHGNIRTSNFLLNNYQYLYLTDFASYKPTYILLDTEQGLREFRLFYASSLDKCNIPPEKLVEKEKLSPEVFNSKRLFNFNIDQSEKDRASTTANSQVSSARKPRKNVYSDDGQCSKQMMRLKMMDMFSLGLSILQVLNDGRSPMSYSDLLRFKKEGLDFSQIIKDSVNKLSKGSSALTYLLTNLLKQNPDDRISAEKAQQIISGVIVDHEMYFVLWTILSAFSKSSFTSCDLRIKLIYELINFIETQLRANSYKWANQPPRCLSNFKALKIFVEMLDKKNRMIFSPHLEGDRKIIDQLLSFFEKSEQEQKESTQHKEDTVELCYLQSNDERRKFFIPTAKHSKIVKRLSIALDLSIKNKELCPPSLKEIHHLFDKEQEPIKLTSLDIKIPPLQQKLRLYKDKQYIREERLKQPKYYSICEVLIKVVFGCIRGCKYVASKLVAIQIMSMLGKDCSDNFRLHVLLPYLMHISEDNDISVCREAFFSFVDLFYAFIDPFNSQEDTRYYEVILEYLANIIRYSKNSKLRATLFSNFKQVFSILQWLQIHYRRFNTTVKIQVTRLLDVLQANYGYFSKEEIRLLLNGNIPDHHLPYMFKFYLSIMNSDKLQGLKLSSTVAMNVSSSMHREILDVFDSCVEGGLDQAGIALVYSIQYFTIRKNTSTGIIRKIVPHVIHSSKWVRDQALKYIKMCLTQFPPTKNYFFFKDIFPAPFPLKPEDIVEEEVLLPEPLKDSDIDWNEKRLKVNEHSPTIDLFVEYLTKLRSMPKAQKKKSNDQIEKWNQTLRVVLETANEGKLLQFQAYIKRQLQVLYEYNLLYYVQNLLARYSAPEKDKPQDKSYQLSMAFKKINKPIDLTSIDYQKKELFQHYQAYINSSLQRILYKKNRDYGEPVSDKIKLAEAIITIGEVLTKFEMFKIRPIPKLGTYIRPPNAQEKLQRPKGILISEVFQHTDAVTCLEKVADQFILSGSADGSLRIFDARKIQANVTMSSEGWIDMRGEGEEKAKISAVATFEQTYAAVVGSNRGQIRVYPVERFQKNQNMNRGDQIVKYAVGGQLEKIVTLTNQLKNECFCYITAEGNLGIQDIRVKSRAMGCSIGRERGLPRALCATNRQSILVGTIDGYVVIFDVRFNVISGVLQLQQQRQTLPITNIVSVPTVLEQQQPLFAFTYPSKHFEFCCFNLQENKQQFGPQRQYTSNSPEQIVTTPSFINRTSDQQFKLCRNGLMWRKNYQELRDFSKNFNIFDYLSDPLTLKEAKIREVWLDNSKNRYNQISSLYNKRSLPFLEYNNCGILTACNPLPTLTHQIQQRPAFAFLTERKEPLRDPSELERPLTIRPNNSHKIFGFNGEQTREYFTCCKVLPNLVVAGCRNSQLKIYV